jgi:hypothetical protein
MRGEVVRKSSLANEHENKNQTFNLLKHALGLQAGLCALLLNFVLFSITINYIDIN